MTRKRLGSYTARQELMTHPRYRYRGCAPDVDDPSVAAGDLSLSVGAWQAPDVDGGESAVDRVAREDAAIEVCVQCPVMVQCLAFGESLNRGGKLAVPHGILGGVTGAQRQRAFVRERETVAVVVEPAPDHELRTVQKLAFLRALAAHAVPEAVADAAGLDVRTANWQLSILKTKLGLAKDASRMEVLEAAAGRGLLSRGEVVADPERRPAAVQLSLDEWLFTTAAPVTDLFATVPVLEAAA